MDNWNKLTMKDKAKYIKLALDSGITDLNIIRDTYNKYQDGGEKETKSSKTKDVKDIINNFTLNPNTIRSRFYKHFDPYLAYTDEGIDRAINLIIGGNEYAKRKYQKHKDFLGNPLPYNEGAQTPFDDAVWAEYLKIPSDQKNNSYTLKQSNYKPTKGTEDTKYFTIPITDRTKSQIIEEGLQLNFGENKNSRALFDYNMGISTIGRGIDNKGEYISYYDKWDINPLHGQFSANNIKDKYPLIYKLIPKNGSDALFGFTNPVSFYDRIYLDDYYGVKQQLNPDEYYGGWLPEVNIFSTKYQNGGIIDGGVLPEVTITPTPEEKALLYTKNLLKTSIPFNDYSKATDMAGWRKFITKFTDKGVSNCTLNATNAYGDKYTRASARNIVKGDPMFEEITGTDKVAPGVMMIQSLPNKSDDENIYHSTIFSGIADTNYINEFGDNIQKGDSLYRYSTGKANQGDYRERPKQALMQNHGKTKFRYFRVKR